MTTLSTSRGQAPHTFAGRAANADDDKRPTQPDSPATGTQHKPRGEPERPTDKPLPDLPNPTEVGEDG